MLCHNCHDYININMYFTHILSHARIVVLALIKCPCMPLYMSRVDLSLNNLLFVFKTRSDPPCASIAHVCIAQLVIIPCFMFSNGQSRKDCSAERSEFFFFFLFFYCYSILILWLFYLD